jgi:hypothetical protein
VSPYQLALTDSIVGHVGPAPHEAVREHDGLAIVSADARKIEDAGERHNASADGRRQESPCSSFRN